MPKAQTGDPKELMENHRQVTELYHDCALGKRDLIEAVKPPEAREPRWWEFWKIYW